MLVKSIFLDNILELLAHGWQSVYKQVSSFVYLSVAKTYTVCIQKYKQNNWLEVPLAKNPSILLASIRAVTLYFWFASLHQALPQIRDFLNCTPDLRRKYSNPQFPVLSPGQSDASLSTVLPSTTLTTLVNLPKCNSSKLNSQIEAHFR